ncbi:type VI secretion system membrane subunit TssM [Morganella psychrotolerans]|uniref:Type VI secretion system membrane subunit TssM n=1 Tax=Morganella psychrotolerans TaxID=368603 RepID=A0A5M9R8J2_9GAMM|nr:type VI secretion system membrane subunit TssM [Morganella psychrotolerans]KAA8716326.1 type VI secretion system membrane subunit TssM [Morganella psychrotolerans]OBU02315.1 hypothetical protein AYY16_16145 [Morganella psychrotolerans]
MIRRFLILIIALIVCYAIWWVGPIVAIGTFYPLAGVLVRQIIIGIILFWALWPFMAFFFSRIFRFLRTPLPKPRKKIIQLDRVTARFTDAVRTLQFICLAGKKTRQQRMKIHLSREYINEKPWFVVMGPPGCGKTSVIYDSGEQFLLSEQYGLARTTDIGPTQDCNWWLTERAVWIDTAGEWVQLHGQSDDAGFARQKLFSLIRKHRRYPGIDGIILCADVSTLLYAPLTERKSLADTLRIRILEMASIFQSDIPVYLLLNNIDHLPGGEAFLNIVDDNLLNGGLGINLKCTDDHRNNFIDDEDAYHGLQVRVSNYILEMLHNVPDDGLRHQLLLFIESLGALRKPLFSFLEQIFPASVTGYTGCLRQLWLGSTTSLMPRETLYDPEADGLFDERQSGAMYLPALTQAITERGVLHTARYRPLRSKIFAAGRYSLAVVSLLALLLLLSSRYFWESDFISYATARFEETKRIVRDIPVTSQINDDLIAAYEQLGYINTQFLESSPPLMTPYFEHTLLSNAMAQTYRRHLYKSFWPAVENYIANELKQGALNGDADVYDTLKVYLMMVYPSYREPQALEDWFMIRWDNYAVQGYTESDRRLFRYHLHELFSDTSSTAPAAKMNSELLRIARVNSMKTPIHLRVVNRIKDKPLPASIRNISLADAAGPSVSLMLRRKSTNTVTDTAVPGFYTRAGYRDVFLPQLQEAATDMIREENWVLRDGQEKRNDPGTQEAIQTLAAEALNAYLSEYANQWDRFLGDIRVRPISDLDDAAQLARQFSEPSSPLTNLVQFAINETMLSRESREDVSGWFAQQENRLTQTRRSLLDGISNERATGTTPEKNLEARFEALHRLRQSATAGSNDPLFSVSDQVYSKLATVSASLRAGKILPQNSEISRLRDDMARQPEPVRSVMMDLLSTGEQQSLQKSKENLSRGASSIASDSCRTTISGRYPFNRNAREEAGIGDFTRMFGRGGAIQVFFDENLAAYVNTGTAPWQIHAGSRGVVSARTVVSFENAARIRDAFFNPAGEMSMSMIIRPVSLSPSILEAVLDIDGQIIRYSHGYQEPVKINWPGPKGGIYVRLTFKTQDGRVETVSFDGPWALFRMYDAGNPVQLSSNSRQLTIAMSAVKGFFIVELNSTMKDYPLWSRALKQFSCPGNI